MRLSVVRLGKPGAVILHGDNAAIGGFFGLDRDLQRRGGVGVKPVFDGILHQRLQGKRGHAEHGMRRVERNDEVIRALRLHHGKISARMLKFFRERDGLLACDRIEVFAKIRGKIQRNPLCLLRVLLAKIIDACHRVVEGLLPKNPS